MGPNVDMMTGRICRSHKAGRGSKGAINLGQSNWVTAHCFSLPPDKERVADRPSDSITFTWSARRGYADSKRGNSCASPRNPWNLCSSHTALISWITASRATALSLPHIPALLSASDIYIYCCLCYCLFIVTYLSHGPMDYTSLQSPVTSRQTTLPNSSI